MKTFVFRSMIGIFFGAFLAVCITNAVVLFGENEMLEGTIFLKNSLGAMFCGWFFSASPLYFELKNLRLSQQTALHFITVVLLYFPLSLGIGWIPFNVPSILIAVVLFLLIYAVIWSGFYLYFKNVAKQLNDDLQHL